MSESLEIEYDQEGDILTVEGIKYSGSIFRNMGSAFAIGETFMFLNRENGVVTVTKIRKFEDLK